MQEVEYFGVENIVWPESESGTVATSSPLCLDQHRYLKTRTCDSFGVWNPLEPPTCTFVQHYEFGGCPFHFIQLPNTSFCLQIRESSDNDYYLDTNFQPIFDLPTADREILLEWLQHRGGDPLYWMPAEYIDTDVYWTSASRSRNPLVTEFEISRRFPFIENTFVLANLSDPRNLEYYLENGSKLHQSLLVYYEETTSLRDRICPARWVGSRLFDYAACFQLRITELQKLQPSDNLQSFCSQGSVFVIDSARKTHIFQELANMYDDGVSETHYCLFNYIHSNDLPITAEVWEESTDSVNYVNWADNWHSDSGYLMVDFRTGKWLFSESYSCVVCEMYGQSEEIIRPILNFMERENAFSLTIRPVELAWGAAFESPDILCMESMQNLSRKPVPITISKMKGLPIANGYSEMTFLIEPIVWNPKPTYYMCKFFDLRLDFYVSNEVFAYFTANDTFALIIKTNCTDFYNFTREYFVDALKTTESPHMEFITVFDAEMKIEYLINNKRHFLYHLTVSLSAFYTSSEENRLGMTDSELRVFYLYRNLSEILPQIFHSKIFKFVSLNNTVLCLPTSISNLNSTFNWLTLEIGVTSPPIEHYVCSNGLPPMRKCIGDDVYGGVWSSIINDGADCQSASEPTSQLLRILQTYKSSYQTKATLSKVYEILNSNYTIPFPLPIDVWTISKILIRMNKLKPILDTVEASLTLNIYNELSSIDDDILRRSATLNSTNQLLYSLDIVMNGLEFSKKYTRSVDHYQGEGLEIFRKKRLIAAIINPKIANITGIGLFTMSARSNDDLGSYKLISITKFQSPIGLLMDDQLTIATYMSASLLDQLQNKHGQINKIVVIIFINDKLFQSGSTEKQQRVDRMVISISVPQLDTNNLPRGVSTFFRSSAMDYISRNVCHYWNYNDQLGWSIFGMRLSGIYMNNVQCTSMHLTHFGHLLMRAQQSQIDERILDTITMLGCTVSFLGIFIIFATAVKFPQWRTKPSTRLLLQFCAAITLQLLLFGVSQFDVTSVPCCIVIGSLHHYAVLLVFLWQLIIAYLQFMRYVVVLHSVGTDSWIRNVSAVSWCLPTLPVIVLLIVNPLLYIPDLKNGIGMCYPQGNGLVFGLLMPIGTAILINFIMFGMVFWNLFCKPKVVTSGGTTESRMLILQLRLFVLLFFLLGLTWLFGFFASFPGVGIVFAYLFCMTATIQGLMLFVYFIVMDPMVRRMWLIYFRNEFCRHHHRN